MKTTTSSSVQDPISLPYYFLTRDHHHHTRIEETAADNGPPQRVTEAFDDSAVSKEVRSGADDTAAAFQHAAPSGIEQLVDDIGPKPFPAPAELHVPSPTILEGFEGSYHEKKSKNSCSHLGVGVHHSGSNVDGDRRPDDESNVNESKNTHPNANNIMVSHEDPPIQQILDIEDEEVEYNDSGKAPTGGALSRSTTEDADVESQQLGDSVENAAVENAAQVGHQGDSTSELPIIPEAFLVVDPSSRDITAVVGYAEPLLPWYKQKHAKIIFAFICIAVIAIAIAFGVLLSSSSSDEPQSEVTKTSQSVSYAPTPQPIPISNNDLETPQLIPNTTSLNNSTTNDPSLPMSECMEDFHLVVPTDAAKQTADTSWELSGNAGILLGGNQFSGSSTIFNHSACLGPGTYTFTTWQELADQYSLSYQNTTLSTSEMDYGQLLTTGESVLEVVDISSSPFTWIDIGSTVAPGNSKNDGTGSWIVEGAGAGIKGNSDSFHYLYVKARDDVNFTTYIEEFSGGTELSVGGIMFREALDEDSKHFSMFVTGEHELQNRYRCQCNGCETATYNEPTSTFKSVWLRLSKDGNAFSTYFKSKDLEEWNKYGSTTHIHFSSPEYFVGFAVSAHNAYSPATLDASNVEILLQRENEIREFMFTLWEEQKILPYDGGTNDLFGTAVALHGNTTVFGAPSNDNDMGHCRVFTRVEGVWKEHAKLEPLDGQGGEMFRAAVALDGDTLVIGANQASDSDKGEYTGAAYILLVPSAFCLVHSALYIPPCTFCLEHSKLLPQDVVAGDMFGFSVVLDGTTLVVGAPSFQNEMGGAAYVFIHDGDTWKEQAKLLPQNRSSDMNFGCAVALDGDTAVVGAYRDNNGNDEKNSSAYVFVRNGGMWDEQAKLLPQNGTERAEFGSTVALDGDTVVVGAPNDGEIGTSSGSVHVFIRAGDASWIEQIKLLSHDGQSFDKFGIAVALDEDNIVVGAQGDSDKGFRGGAAYLFSRSGGIWEEKTKLLAHDGDEGDWFGSAVALDGDTSVISARLDDENGVESGSAYIFSTPLSELARSKSPLISQDASKPSLQVHAPAPPTQCTYVDVGINVFTDWQPEETSWDFTKVIRTDGSTEREVFFKGSAELGETLYSDTKKMCLENGEYEFNFFDSGGDGLTCTNGYYNVTLDGQHIAGSRAGGGRWKFSQRTIPFSIPFSCEEVKINVRTDERKYDTSWTLARIIAADLISNNSEVVILDEDEPEYDESLHTDTVCLEFGEYNFTIYDSQTRQDGLCCDYDEGFYNIASKEGELIAKGDQFGEYQIVLFSVPFVASQSPSAEPTGSPPPSFSPSVSLFPTESASPTAYCEEVQIDIMTDDYPEDTTWKLSRLIPADDGSYYAEGVDAGNPVNVTSLHTYAMCLETGEYNFTLYDEYGNGICCEDGDGSYNITVNGEIVAEGGEFMSESETVSFSILACEWIEVEVSFDESPVGSGWVMSQITGEEEEIIISSFFPGDASLAHDTYVESFCLEKGKYKFVIYDGNQNKGVDSYFIKSKDGEAIAEGSEFDYQDIAIFNIPLVS